MLAALLLKYVQFGDNLSQNAHDSLAEAWEQMQGMKQRQASPQEWAQFQRETLEWLEPTLESLGEAAVRNETGFHLTALSVEFASQRGQRAKEPDLGRRRLKEVLLEAGRRSLRPPGVRSSATGTEGRFRNLSRCIGHSPSSRGLSTR